MVVLNYLNAFNVLHVCNMQLKVTYTLWAWTRRRAACCIMQLLPTWTRKSDYSKHCSTGILTRFFAFSVAQVAHCL